MADQAALQEAIQRARQLAAKISQNVPVKRTASEMDDHSIGQVKVTLAYEKPANTDNNNKEIRSSTNSSSSSSSNHRGKDGGSGGVGGDGRSDGRGDGRGASQAGVRISDGYSSGSADDRIEIIIPHAVIGLVIGKGGENIKRIQSETGATVRVDPNTVDEKGNKVCTITGTKRAVQGAHDQVASVIENAESGKRPRTQVDGSDQYRMIIPASRTGAIIGKGGETIKSIKQQSGCDIELDKAAKECEPDESVFIIRGTQDKILKARTLIEQRLASRGRDNDGYGRSGGSSSKGLATGANAAPVAPYTDLPSTYPAVGQQSSADMSAAWAAYFAQYSSLFSQTGAQQGTPQVPQLDQSQLQTQLQPQVPQPQIPQPQMPQQQQPHQPHQQQQQPSQLSHLAGSTTTQPQQDYTDQWIEFYLANGRPDYAEQIIEMKKQQQQQQQQPSKRQ